MTRDEQLLEAYRRGYRVTADGIVLSPSGRRRKTDLDTGGYPRFSVAFADGIRTINVHRLLAYQKYGEQIFESGLEVRHENGDKADCSWGNVLLGTHSENMQDKPADVRMACALYATSFVRRLSSEQEDQLRADRSSGMTYKQLGIKYGLAKSTISYIMHKQRG